jgi:hypothetical protein
MKPLNFGTALLGELSAAGRAIPNMLSAGVHGVDDLSQTLVGHGGEPGVLDPLAKLLHVGPSDAERNLTSNIATLPGVQAAGNAVTGADQALNTKLGQVSPALQHGVQATGRVAGDINSLIPVAGPLKALGSATGDALGALTAETRVAPDVAPTPVQQAGFVTPDKSATGKFLAGDSAQTVQNLHNQQLHQTLGGAAANIPRGTPLLPENFAPARAEPASTYTSAADSLPTSALSPAAHQMIDSAGGPGERITTGTPDAQNSIAALKAQLLDPDRTFTGNQVVNELSGLRQEGYADIGSEDISKQQLAQAKLDMANGLEQHISDTLPANAPVSMADLAKARQALAMNHTVEGITKPGGLIDPQALARIHANNPNLLTGNLRTMAQAATDNPEVNTLPTKSNLFQPPGIPKDVQGVGLMKPVGSVVQALFGALGRRMLTGNTGAAVAAAQRQFPGMLGEDLAPSAPRGPQPPPGMTASTPTAPPPAPAPPPGSIPQADLLSHGVETGTPLGLSLAPDVPPPGNDTNLSPQDLAAAFDTRGMELEHPAVTQSKALEQTNHAVMTGAPQKPNSDMGSVMSQGVPEGVVQRSAPVHTPQLGDLISGNAGAAPPSAPPEGPRITPNTEQSDIPGRAVLPGSTVISRGGNFDPGNFKAPPAQIVTTPQEDGSTHITSHFVDPASRQQGLGQQTLMDALQHHEATAGGAPIHGDETMTNDILHVATALQRKGLIDFDYHSPQVQAAAEKAMASKKEGVVVSGNGSPVIRNIRLTGNGP